MSVVRLGLMTVRLPTINGCYKVPPVGASATYMGDYCRTGVNAMIMPGTKIGSYSVIGPGVILNENVPSNNDDCSETRASQRNMGTGEIWMVKYRLGLSDT